MWGALKSSRTARLWPILYWLPTGIVFASHWFELKAITGRSMQPTLNPNSSLWRDIGLFRRDVDIDAKYSREDIVTLRSPENHERLLIKRIVAKEGDTVRTLPPYPDAEVVIPKNHVWVEGDEHFWSDDSNRFGPISECLVESRLVMVVWPLSRFGAPNSKPTQSDKEYLAQTHKEQVRCSRVKQAKQPHSTQESSAESDSTWIPVYIRTLFECA
ncbi:LexA/Signal peptidase [Pholiota conissans]|uniref:Mitochondrial inner membrane protease subunit 2 n=1 Tax=Pholiota conissans TaxID=109636 RepID=A0A9P5Z6G2_9AGAR|nr:LexA/Signal peptidase [Pholiota conissans]